MSEVTSRPAATRGRGVGRGGRGGFSSRGGARGASRTTTNGDSKHEPDSLPTLEDEGEIGDLKKLYGSKTGLIKEMFPDWSDVDILFALRETDGDENLTVTRIAEGTISQWGEVSKQKKDRSKSKAKDTFTTTTGTDASSTANTRHTRGGRSEGGRGRGRATERGGRAARGRSSAATTNGHKPKDAQQLSVPTEDAWDTTKTSEDTAWDTTGTEAAAAAAAAPAATTTAQKPSVIPEGTQKTWASMLRASTVPKPAPKPKEAPAPKPEPPIEPLPPAELAATEPEPQHDAPVELSAEPEKPSPAELPAVVVPEIALMPSKDQLTETNLEQVVDESNPPDTETARSEAADSWDPRAAAVSATATPLSASQQHHQQAKAPTSGFAATALKATERGPSRTPSYQRRILDQEEPVRMPGNREVDRAAVQFGAFSLNGLDDDIDGDREEPETRAQPPVDSPVAHPRTSLPPVPQPAAVPEAFSTPKPSTSLPPAAGPTAAPTAPAAQQPTSAQVPQPPTQPSSQQFGRFGQSTAQEPSSFSQKPFDTYNQQANPPSAPSQYDGFPSQQQSQPQGQQAGGAFSSAPTEYSSYYTADPQSRGQFNYYNQQYGQQQSGQGQQEGGLPSQQRSFSGYGGPQNDISSQYPQSANQSRFGAGSTTDLQTSGNTTPNPSAAGQQTGQNSQSQSHGGQQQHGGQYPYTHPYYSSPYYAAYMNQQYGGYGQGGFGGPYGKGGVYGQPQQYGMSPQGPYDHSSSPATGYGQSSLHRADSGLGSGLGDYGRAGSAQSGSQPGLGGSGFGGINDTFGRGASSYGSQSGQPFNAAGSQPGAGAPSANDDLKPFGESKTAGGPSPSLGGARPGSATNNNPSQSGLPPPQSSQQGGMGGYGGYPSHLQGGLHGNQSGSGGYGMGGGAGQGHQNQPYGGYGGGGQGFGGGSYYGGNQPRGWGGNYH